MSSKTPYILDTRDTKIIETICDNARLSYSQIGKLTNISKDSVRERMKNMQDYDVILSFIPFINYRAIGLNLFHVFLKFHPILKNEKKFIEHLKKDHSISSITRVSGEYDLELQILARSKFEIQNKIKDLKKIKSEDIGQVDIVTSKNQSLYSMQTTKDYKKNYFNINPECEKVKIDDLDLKILKMLSNNCREKLTEMAVVTKTSEDVLRHRIKSLLRKKVILGFYTRTNKHRLGLSSYILLLKLDKRALKKLTLADEPNIFYVKECSGNYNAIINFYAKTNSELVKLIDGLRMNFGKYLENMELLILLERHYFSPLPQEFKLDS